ncbi:MAG TPA: acetylglutamate kinase [Armatimonadota bacterium]|nr:acetylglutamate kinase [Armatimonadota bacterium]
MQHGNSRSDMESLRQRAAVLIEALPYLRQFRGHTVVIKYGGAAMVDAGLRTEVLKDVVLLEHVGLHPVLVHGGGPEISEMMRRLGKQPQFIDGQRVSDPATVEIAQMVLTGKTNPDLVSAIHQQGGRAIGLSGKDGGMVLARKLSGDTDLGFVGEVGEINPGLVQGLVAQGFIPVIAPIAAGADGETYNINADHFAGRIAGPIGAKKLVLLTDVRGVLKDRSRPDSLVSELNAATAGEMLTTKQIDAGMIPKVQACLDALAGGVTRCHIIDGRLPHALLMELLTDVGIGTMVVET